MIHSKFWFVNSFCGISETFFLFSLNLLHLRHFCDTMEKNEKEIVLWILVKKLERYV